MEWISVEDRLPEMGERVLLSRDSKTTEPFVFVLDGDQEKTAAWWECVEDSEFIKQFPVNWAAKWMPLPLPPEAE